MELPSFYGQDHERYEYWYTRSCRSRLFNTRLDSFNRKEYLDPHASLIPSPALAAPGSVATLYSTSPSLKRRKLTPPPCERVMIYVRQENELAFTPLHLVPPTSLGLLDAVSSHNTFNWWYLFINKKPNRHRTDCFIFSTDFRLKVNTSYLRLPLTCSTGKTQKGNNFFFVFKFWSFYSVTNGSDFQKWKKIFTRRILAKIDDDMLKHYCNEDLFILEITTSSEEGMYDITLKELYDTWILSRLVEGMNDWKCHI